MVDPKNRAKKLKRRYGITPDDYEALLESQGGLCAICREDPNTRLQVDHNHDNGEVRGLLCRDCNLAIAYMDEDPRRIHSAAVYLINYAPKTQENESEPPS